jgi:tetratricopeptide (TPR) repeat protein
MRHRILAAGAITTGLCIPAFAACASAHPAPARAAAAAPQSDVQRGVSLYNSGKYAEAEAALRGSSDAEAKTYLAASLAKQKKYAEAEALAKDVLTGKPTDDMALAALGQSLVGLGKADEAVQRLSTALEAKPDLAYAYYWRGQAYDKQKKTSSMASDFQMFLKLAPTAPEAKLVQAVLASLK